MKKSSEEIGKMADDYCEGFAREYHNELGTGFYAGYVQCQEDSKEFKYTEADIINAVQLARETESQRKGALSEDWEDVNKYTSKDIIKILDKNE